MSENIIWEITTLVAGIWKGVVFSWGYDNIRILRRVFPHRKVIMMALEDVIYGFFLGMGLFILCFDRADGVVRGFIIAGAILGSIMYFKSVSPFYVKITSGILKFILKNVVAVFKIPMKLLISFIKRVVRYEIRDKESKGHKA